VGVEAAAVVAAEAAQGEVGRAQGQRDADHRAGAHAGVQKAGEDGAAQIAGEKDEVVLEQRCLVPVHPLIPWFPGQWRKCRRPVNTMDMPCSSAAAITSASRMEPPGWITAAMPAAAAASMPSRKGKKASEAITEPATCRPASAAFRPAILALTTRLIWPAPMPTVCRSLA